MLSFSHTVGFTWTGIYRVRKKELPKNFSLKRRLRLLSGNGGLAESAVIDLLHHDHGVQHVAGGLGAFAETGADDFDRNLGDLGSSSRSTEVVFLHDDFLLTEIDIHRCTRNNPQVSLFCFGCVYGKIASDDQKGSSRNIF